MRQIQPSNDNFKFFTGVLKAFSKGDDRFITGVASDTLVDRDGDRMSTSAVKAMQASAEQNLTIFSNHHYDWEESLGSCVEAKTYVAKGIDGQDAMTMDITVKLEPEAANPKTSLLYNKILSGTKLGFSIGGQVRKAFREYDATLRREVNIIDDVELVEISVVGIPANPRAMISAISKSLKEAPVLDVPSTDPTDPPLTGELNREGETDMDKPEVKAESAEMAETQPEVTDPLQVAQTEPLTKAGRAISAANEAKLRTILSTLSELLGDTAATETITKEEDEPKEECTSCAEGKANDNPPPPAAKEEAPAEEEPKAEEEEAEATSDEAAEEEEAEEKPVQKPSRKGMATEVRVTMDPDVLKAFGDLSDQLRAQQEENQRLQALLEAKVSGRKGIVAKPTVTATDEEAPEWANMSAAQKDAMWVKTIFKNRKG